jgi:hypothetical protein
LVRTLLGNPQHIHGVCLDQGRPSNDSTRLNLTDLCKTRRDFMGAD